MIFVNNNSNNLVSLIILAKFDYREAFRQKDSPAVQKWISSWYIPLLRFTVHRLHGGGIYVGTGRQQQLDAAGMPGIRCTPGEALCSQHYSSR